MNYSHKVLISVAIGVSTIFLFKKLLNLKRKRQFKYPSVVHLKQASLNDVENLLLELKKLHPNECCLDIDGVKILLLNSLDSIRKYTNDFGNNTLGDRPHLEVFNIISHGYLGSFFRLFNDDLLSIRKNSSLGLNRLVLNNPSFEDKVFDEIHMFFDFLNRQNEKKICNFPIYLQEFTSNLLLSIGVDIRFDYDSSPDDVYRQQIENMTLLFSSINILNMVKHENTTNSLVKTQVSKAYNFLQGALSEHIPKYDSQIVNNLADFLLSKQEEMKKVRVNLNKEDAYSDEDILVQFFTIFMAGSITLGFSASWLFYYLASNPHIQLKIREEIQAVVGDNDLISIKQRSKMPYVEAFIHEALRLASTLPLIPRATHESIHSNDVNIPKDTLVLYNIYGMQHNDCNWPQTNECIPERWLSEDGKTLCLSKKSYLPFGNSPRKCIGEALSKNILFLMVTHLVKKYKFELSDPSDEINAKLGLMRYTGRYDISIL